MATHVGAIVMSFDGVDVSCRSVTPDENTGRKLLVTFNREGRANETTDGVAQGGLQWEVYIPKNGTEPNWAAISDARVVVETLDGAHHETYVGVGVSTVSTSYSVGNEGAARTLTGFYTDNFKG